MQQTICGETHKKVKLVERKTVDDFLKDHKELYLNLNKSQNCLYQDNKIVSDQVLNYLNVYESSNDREQLKLLIKKEFVDCERVYPYLGDYFVDNFFNDNDKNNNKHSSFLFNKDTSEEFIKSLSFKQNRQIMKWLLDEASLEYNINIQKSVLDAIQVEKIDHLNFELEYDASYLGNMSNHSMKEYKFIIIDGHIDSVGEVHHLLDQAYKTKIPYVIFCFGMNPEVEHVIKYNNTHGKFEVFPVVIPFNENTLNVLNDIAILHKSHILSSKSGQTISQALREELPFGKEITLHKKGFKIKPVASNIDIAIHKRFLEKRLLESSHEEGKKLILKRIRRLSSKSVKIFLPEKIYENNDFLREIDYMLRFLNHSKLCFNELRINNKVFFMPSNLKPFVDNKINSLKSIFDNVEKMVTYARN